MKLQAMTPEEVKNSKIYKEWGLTDKEYETISSSLGRLPNYTETGIFSGMWSEHCSYKTSKPILRNFHTEGPQVLQGPGEGAGIVDIGDNQGIVFKMESHNSPSAVEPYEGAATGVGGCVRDIFSMGATPIALVDSLRFGDVERDRTKYLVEKAVEGIADYGNQLGIPTIAGEVKFDATYNANPLVNAMCVGLVDHDGIFNGIASGVGNPILYAGSTTGRDGIHGASFSSKEFGAENQDQGSAVQAGDPFKEKRLIDAFLELFRDFKNEVIGVQDMGAAGLVSSSSEMASKAEMGLSLNMDLVPAREEAMTAYELLLSESQERMLLCIEKGSEAAIIELFNRYGLEAAVIGEVIGEKQYKIYQQGELVVDLPVDLLADGVPTNYITSKVPERIKNAAKREVFQPEVANIEKTLTDLLTSPDLADKSSLYSQFDHMAMNNTIAGPGSDAGILRIKGTDKAVAITADGNSRYVYLDPYKGGQIAVSESARNIIASGGLPLAITDCLNFGNPNDPEIFYELEESSKGISEACKTLNTPVISGNVSLSNANPSGSIYPTPILGMVGLIEKTSQILTQKFAQAGDVIYLVGATGDDFAGSVIQKLQAGEIYGQINFDLAAEKQSQDFVFHANKKGFLQSAHDLSEGGLLVGLVQKAFGTQLGFDMETSLTDAQLFSETQSRFIVTVSREKQASFEQFIQESNMGELVVVIGSTVEGATATVQTRESRAELALTELKAQWQQALPKALVRTFN
ncbi:MULTISPECIES: phosphoribosylformylglycinamidine synthase subunit PurL [unclassified Jeotgalibaca]|uniref:phosphoribosylformylglycinamidine synthase subunit PurL n=1 Tax=unclassified Jeotgalibaca TaxID=2621505 RepID=UPI003FD20F8D